MPNTAKIDRIISGLELATGKRWRYHKASNGAKASWALASWDPGHPEPKQKGKTVRGKGTQFGRFTVMHTLGNKQWALGQSKWVPDYVFDAFMDFAKAVREDDRDEL